MSMNRLICQERMKKRNIQSRRLSQGHLKNRSISKIRRKRYSGIMISTVKKRMNIKRLTQGARSLWIIRRIIKKRRKHCLL
jgi:hypothetical protein